MKTFHLSFKNRNLVWGPRLIFSNAQKVKKMIGKRVYFILVFTSLLKNDMSETNITTAFTHTQPLPPSPSLLFFWSVCVQIIDLMFISNLRQYQKIYIIICIHIKAKKNTTKNEIPIFAYSSRLLLPRFKKDVLLLDYILILVVIIIVAACGGGGV